MKKQRNLDGYYFNIKRQNVVETVCLSDMNEYEIDNAILKYTNKQLKALVKGLSSRLYQIGEAYNIKL